MSADNIARDGMKPGDVAVITGGGGGFGRAFSLRLATMGARISVWDIDEASGSETARQVKAAGGLASFITVDLASDASIEAAAAATLRQYGAPYCIINNCLLYTSPSPRD